MQPVKAIFNTIFEINEEEFASLINRFETEKCTDCDRQLYILEKKEDDKYIAVDNSSGDMFVEEFTIKEDAYIWLFGLKEVEPLQKAEECEFWW